MISKQAKDFINSINEGFNSDPLGCEYNNRRLNITTPLGSDWDTDRILEGLKSAPVYTIVQSKPSIKEAIEILCEELKDEDYYRSWKDNIAMSFKDEYFRLIGDTVNPDFEQIHIVANKGADNFFKTINEMSNISTRIVRKESTYWKTYGEDIGCIIEVHYKLQYKKKFLFFDYWVDFKETLCGMGDCFTSTIWEKDKDTLIARYNCTATKDKYSYE